MKPRKPVHLRNEPPSNDNRLVRSDQELIMNIVALRPHLVSLARYLTKDSSAAEDLAQNTIEKALEARDTFRSGTNLKGWLSVILRRRFIDEQRHARAQRRMDREFLAEDGESLTPEVPRLSEVVCMKQVLDCLDDLPSRDRELLVSFHFKALSYREMAGRLSIGTNTLGVGLRRSRLKLRHAMSARVQAAG